MNKAPLGGLLAGIGAYVLELVWFYKHTVPNNKLP
jgi:hypothetical protein